MRTLIIASTFVLTGLTCGGVNAMPSLNVAPAVANAPVLVDYACGRGFHLNEWGDCRPNYWRRPPPPRYIYDRGPREGWDGPRGWDDRRPPPRWGWRHHRDDGWDGPRW
jgi:hypothetical protein